MSTDKKTRKRAEDAAADQVKHRGSCAKRVDADPPMWLTSFGDGSTEPPALPCKYNDMIDEGAAAPKPCLSPVEMRTPTVAGGLLPTGTTSTAIKDHLFSTTSFLDTR